MNDLSDLIVVGAGPAGLMTAKRAAELGLKVKIIELKKDITKIKRACSAQFVTDEGYENETVKVESNKIKFTRNNFEVKYTGPLLNIINNYHHSPNGHKIHFAHSNHRPFSIKFDKSHLISDLWNECEKLGVELLNDTLAYNGQNLNNHIRLDVKSHGNTYSLLSKKLVIAEGANAKLTGKFGFNRNRKYYGRPFVFSCIMEGTSGFAPQSWNQYYGSKIHPFAEVIVESALEGNNGVEVTITGTKNLPPYTLFEKFINDSPLSSYFKNAYIIDKKGCSLKSFDSLKTPYKGNVLVIGDSAAHIEVIVQGALMCGYNAANAINSELQGKNGFEEYTKWWNKSFNFNWGTHLDFIKLYGALTMMPKYTDEELDYLFSIIENETLCGNFGQFEVPKTVWKAILSHKKQIEDEKPDLFEKIKPIDMLNIEGKLN